MQFALHQLRHAIRHVILAHSDGHGIHSPLAFNVCHALQVTKTDAERQCQPLKALRHMVLRDSQLLKDAGWGAGSRVFKSEFRPVKKIARWGISTHHKARILFQLIRFFNPHHVLELGTSLGLTTLYMAMAQFPRDVSTVDGNDVYIDFAKRLQKQYHPHLNITYYHAAFETFLNTNATVYDFIFIDGAHDYHTTIALFEYFNNQQTLNQILVFDDIYWSPSMTKAWHFIAKNASQHLILDAFILGIVIKNNNLRCGYHYRINIK
jgi:predicted O-methyltransferase YrrM